MSNKRWTNADFDYLKQNAGTLTKDQIANELGRTVHAIDIQASRLGLSLRLGSAFGNAPQADKEGVSIDTGRNKCVISSKSRQIRTLGDLISAAEIDLSTWEIDRHVINKWEVPLRDEEKDLVYSSGKPDGIVRRHRGAWVETIWQIKVWLKRKTPEVTSLEWLLSEIESNSPTIPIIKRAKSTNTTQPRELEVSLYDPHMGLQCFPPAADGKWDLTLCYQTCLDVLDRLLHAARSYSPFEQIIFPFGHDFVHADTVFHTTTAGTPQPEALSWHEVFIQAERLAISIVERLKEEAPVKLLVVPGNHARQTDFTLARVVRAWYHNDKNVTVQADPSPYKFHRYGVNLIGFEHGHSIKQQVRLAALMANECREDWAKTAYREWHLGDQHRKGASRPTILEEQGVSVEFLPGLTPPNEWHRLKSYNWQKRAGMGFVWHKRKGPEARLQVNINSYTGKVMGD